jgi:hypothetical protein
MAFDEAARLYQWAITLSGNDPSSSRVDILTRIALCYSKAGHPQIAAQWYDRAASEEVDSTSSAQLLRIRGTLELLRGGSVDSGLSRLLDIIRENGGRLPSGNTRFMLEVVRYVLGNKSAFLSAVLGGNPYFQDFETLYLLSLVFATTRADLSALFIQQTILVAKRDPANNRTQCLTRCVEAIFEAGPGWKHLAKVEAVCRLAGSHATRCADPYAGAMQALASAITYFLTGMPKDNLEQALKAEEIFRSQCTGCWWEITTARTLRICALGWSGRARDYTREVQDICSEARSRGDRYALSSLSLLAWSYLSSLFDDNPEAARSQIDDGLAHWSNKSGFDFAKYSAHYGLADTAIYEGDGKRALEVISYLQGQLKSSFFRHWQIFEVMLLHLQSRALSLLLASGVVEPARLKAIRSRLRALATPWTLGALHALDASIAASKGAGNESVNSLSLAEAHFERIGLNLFAQSCRRQRGHQLGGSVGIELVRESTEWMRSRGIRNPEKLSAATVPVPGTRRQAQG